MMDRLRNSLADGLNRLASAYYRRRPNPSDAVAFTVRAAELRRTGSVGAASRLAELAIASDPLYVDAYREWALACRLNGEPENARGVLQIGLQHVPLERRHVLLADLGDTAFEARNFAEAEEWWRKALLLRPDLEPLREAIARAAAAQGKSAESDAVQ